MSTKIEYPEKIIDCSTWVGNWAFYYLRYGKLEILKERLEKYNISKAYVSPIEAILEQEPTRANNALFESIDKLNNIKNENPDERYFSPVPIIDLSICNWQEMIDVFTKRNDVKIIKLLPNYHMYDLTEDALKMLVEYTLKYNFIISIQMKIEDTRGQHPLMKVPDVQIEKVVKVISNFPEQKFIINNGYINDVDQVLYSFDNVYADISSVETQDILSTLSKRHGTKRLLFSTHSAFYYPEGNLFKLAYSTLNKEDLNKIAYENAKELGL